MTRVLAVAALILAGAAVCLGALWLSMTTGVWLALHTVAGVGPTTTQLVVGAGFVVMLVMLTKAVCLLVADLRREAHR